LTRARREVDESLHAVSGRPVARTMVLPPGVKPIDTAPSYRPAQVEIVAKSGLSPVPIPTGAAGELMTDQQRMAWEARRKIAIEHSMGPRSPDFPDDPPVA
ncbi:MAG TPA: hypothetical protein VD706_00435, partial [Candidatus Saccharimonadales bacterium]|nr:hypothetical protein [Candidatus Saccharimonadales bacterium]